MVRSWFGVLLTATYFVAGVWCLINVARALLCLLWNVYFDGLWLACDEPGRSYVGSRFPAIWAAIGLTVMAVVFLANGRRRYRRARLSSRG